MTSEPNIGEAYGVSLAHDGLVRLELIVTKAEFPAFTLVMPALVAARIGEALLANANFSVRRSAAADQAARVAHGS